MKKLVTFLLLASFTVQTFQISLLVADYYVNKEAFAGFCINKARPQLHCNGQCVLMKKLAEKSNQEKESSQFKKENSSQTLFSESYFASLNLVEAFFSTSTFTINDKRLKNFSVTVFRPPCTVS